MLIQYTIDSGHPGPHVLITAGVHGDEPEPMLAALALARQLPARLDNGRVTVVPVVNPTAGEAGQRTGTDGLDLARVCPGQADGSATQRAAADVSTLIREADYYIDMHTGGYAFDIYPLAGYMRHPDAGIRQAQHQLATAFGLPLIWATSCLPNGRTLSVARDAGIPAIYVEYGGGSGFQQAVVTAYQNGCINVLKHLAMLDTPPVEQAEAPLFVDDDLPDGGFLQGKIPAPDAGIFVASVGIGQRVETGQLWGHIIDPVRGGQVPVFADGNGLVFLLRVQAAVKKGDALGGIMPVEAAQNPTIRP